VIKKISVFIMIFVLFATAGCNVENNMNTEYEREVQTDNTKSEIVETSSKVPQEKKKKPKKNVIDKRDIMCEKLEQDITDENGNVLVKMTAYYPVIENPDNALFVNQINERIKKEVDLYFSIDPDIAKAAGKLQEKQKEKFQPYVIEYKYSEKYNKNNIISLSIEKYQNTGGAHPDYSYEVKNYDINKCRDMTLRDVFDENAMDEDFFETVSKLFRENVLEEYKTAIEELPIEENIENVKFYITEDGITLYFDVYQIGPHALGKPEAVIPFDDSMFLFNVKNGEYK